MLRFEKEVVTARFISPSGATVQAPIEIRTNPISGRTCRVAFSRIGEREAGTDFLPAPPPFAGDTSPSARSAAPALRQRRRDCSGRTGDWEWLVAYAPEGFFEIWGILPRVTSLSQVTADGWKELACGVLNTQRFYRSLCRNGYNLGLLLIEDGMSRLELRVVIVARSNYAAWVRSDHTGFEVMLGEMATFTAPEETAKGARPFWN